MNAEINHQTVSVVTLDDFGGTLEDLKKIVDELLERHGPQAYLWLDAGHNNVSVWLNPEKAKTS